jgi:hypothetical protein
MSEILEIITAEVNIKRLLHRLEFSPDEIEKAAIDQPRLYLEASRFRVQMMHSRAKLLHKLEVIKAKARLRYRGQRKAAGGRGSLTEGAITSMVDSNRLVRKYRRRLDAAYVREEFGKLLVEVLRSRQSTLKVVAETRNAEINSEIRAVKDRMATADMRREAKKARHRFERMGR